jgi:hypothetical protein
MSMGCRGYVRSPGAVDVASTPVLAPAGATVPASVFRRLVRRSWSRIVATSMVAPRRDRDLPAGCRYGSCTRIPSPLDEHRTAALAASELARAGYRVTTGVGGTGVVGVLANGAGPVVLVRGDMDALPVHEETGLAYASAVSATLPDGNTTGVMHACGHDVHTTTLLATSALVAELRASWTGTVVVVAEPAEEIGRGADLMIRDGLFTRFPKPDACVALHVAADPRGEIGVTPGFFLANVDSVDVTIFGRGGHGPGPRMPSIRSCRRRT